jgi:hypothetical protein
MQSDFTDLIDTINKFMDSSEQEVIIETKFLRSRDLVPIHDFCLKNRLCSGFIRTRSRKIKLIVRKIK